MATIALKRKIEEDMLAWKQNPNRLSLLVKGARQVGKTFSIERFAAANYKSVIYLNFVEDGAYAAIFEGGLDPETIMRQISLRVPKAEFIPGNTVLVLDEIQNCPRARAALKFLAVDSRFDVIASGSMLGIHYKDVPSYPVGYVDTLEMHSLDFEEFLWANDVKPQSISDIRECYLLKQPVPQAMHERMLELLREYIVVGGMPHAVSVYATTHNFKRVLDVQRGILEGYADDISKYAEGAEKTKARACFLSIPKHLAKDHKKFSYSLVEKGGTARKYGGSLMWLHDAGIVSFCYNLTAPALPLEGNARSDMFKVYMRDTGLLLAMLEDGAQEDVMDGRLGIYKGAVYENIVADMFAKAGKRLYYYEKDQRLEIDFFIRYQKDLTAVEVKSAENTKAKSLATVLCYRNVQRGIKLSTKNVGAAETADGKPVETLPLYMAMFF